MLFLDTEFNSHGGQLISIALVSTEGDEFYSVLDIQNMVLGSWVKDNVIPHLWKDCVYNFPKNYFEPYDNMRLRLFDFLKANSYHEIVADWPADFQHLMDILCGPSYDKSLMLSIRMTLYDTTGIDIKPKIPHNALSDARALMEYYTYGKIS